MPIFTTPSRAGVRPPSGLSPVRLRRSVSRGSLRPYRRGSGAPVLAVPATSRFRLMDRQLKYLLPSCFTLSWRPLPRLHGDRSVSRPRCAPRTCEPALRIMSVLTGAPSGGELASLGEPVEPQRRESAGGRYQHERRRGEGYRDLLLPLDTASPGRPPPPGGFVPFRSSLKTIPPRSRRLRLPWGFALLDWGSVL